MKLSVVAATGLFAVALGTKPKKCSKNCFNAIVSDTPANLGEAFCSSFLSLQPLEAATTTITVVRDEIVTTTNTNSETTTATVTTTDSTITTTTGTVTVLAKRAQTLVDPSSSILSACKTKSALISSICSHLVPAATTAPATTVTVEQTSTSTTVVEVTTTTVDTATDTATATEYAVATAQATTAFANGAFTGSILPWKIVDTPSSSNTVEHLKNKALCIGPACTENDMLLFTVPFAGFAAITQTFDALPSTTYKVGLNFHAPQPLDPSEMLLGIRYNQADLGTLALYNSNTSPLTRVSLWEFTTDSSGKGTLEIRVTCESESYCGELYLDGVTVDKKLLG